MAGNNTIKALRLALTVLEVGQRMGAAAEEINRLLAAADREGRDISTGELAAIRSRTNSLSAEVRAKANALARDSLG